PAVADDQVRTPLRRGAVIRQEAAAADHAGEIALGARGPDDDGLLERSRSEQTNVQHASAAEVETVLRRVVETPRLVRGVIVIRGQHLLDVRQNRGAALLEERDEAAELAVQAPGRVVLVTTV